MYIFTILLIASGLLHFYAFPERYKISKITAYAYMFAGLAQIILGIFFIDLNYPIIMLITTILNCLLVVYWGLSQTVLADRGYTTYEPLTYPVILRKVLEVTVLILLLI